MSRTGSNFDGRSSAARDAGQAVVGYVLFTAILAGVTVLNEESVTPVLAVGGVVVLGTVLDFAIVRFSLLEALGSLVTRIGLMAVCIWGLLFGESPILVAITASAGGWLMRGAVQSLRGTESGGASE